MTYIRETIGKIGGGRSHALGLLKALGCRLVQYHPYLPIVFVRDAHIIQRHSRFSIAGAFLSIFGARFCLEFNGSEVWMLRNWGKRRWVEKLQIPMVWVTEQIQMRFAHKIVVVSEAVKRDHVPAKYHHKTVVVPNGIDVDRFYPMEQKPRVFTVGWAGTFSYWHGIDVIIEAYRLAPDIRWMMIGDGPLRGWAEREMPNALFLGKQSPENMPRLYNLCDALVNASQNNVDGSEFFGSPTKLFEYMACGKPVLTTPYGQPGEIIVNWVNGLIFETPQELVEGLSYIRRNPKGAGMLGRRARQTAEQYTWEKQARGYL